MPPQCYTNYQTVHRRFKCWRENEVHLEVLTDLSNELRDNGDIDESVCFIVAMFYPTKGGGAEIGNTKRRTCL